MTDLIVFSAIGSVVLVLIVWSLMRHNNQNSKLGVFLSFNGFQTCEEEQAGLLDRVVSLERNSEYRYSIKNPTMTDLNGNPVYFYQKTRQRHNRLYAVEEFQFPFSRESSQPFIFYLKPRSLGDGMAASLIKSVVSADWDAQPDDLVKLDIPASFQEGILNVLGPEGASLQDHISAAQLERITQGGDHGILVIRLDRDVCSFEFMRNYPGADLKKVWSFIQEMMMESPLREPHTQLVT